MRMESLSFSAIDFTTAPHVFIANFDVELVAKGKTPERKRIQEKNTASKQDQNCVPTLPLRHLPLLLLSLVKVYTWILALSEAPIGLAKMKRVVQ